METLVFKPTLKKYFAKGNGYVRVAIGLILIIVIAVLNKPDQLLFWASPTVLAILAIIVATFHLRRVTISEAGITYRNWFGISSTITPQAIGSVVIARKYYEMNFGEVQRALVIRPNGSGYFSLTSAYWQDELFAQLTTYGTNHNVKVITEDEPIDSPTLVKKYGKALPYYERHIFATAFMVVGGIILAYTIWFILFEL
jgi:hypothetical protein